MVRRHRLGAACQLLDRRHRVVGVCHDRVHGHHVGLGNGPGSGEGRHLHHAMRDGHDGSRVHHTGHLGRCTGGKYIFQSIL